MHGEQKMSRPKSSMKSKTIYTSKPKAKSRLQLQGSSTKCKYWPSPKAPLRRPLPPLTKAKSCKLLPVKSKKLLPTVVVTVASTKKGKSKGKQRMGVVGKGKGNQPKVAKNAKQCRSNLMRRALKPLIPTEQHPPTNGRTTTTTTTTTTTATAMRSPKRSKSFRKSQSPIMPKTGTQVVDASGIKSKKNRGTPVLFLVKDSAKPQQFMEPMRSMRKRSKLQKPQSHSRSRSRSRAGSWSQAEARADYDASDRRTAYDKSYTKAISELSHSRRPAVGGVEFFYNLGQRVAPPKQRTRLPPLQRLAGGGVGGDDHVTDLEVPLTSRLPIIDFISTTEFQSMYAPQAKRAARRFLM